jgi:DNA (cytosine-5)-methyltransferase 1
MTLTVGSLFSGIGGLDLGLERAGMQVIWQSEIDPYACKVLSKHWPEVVNHGDIKEINWEEIERPNVICGGYPCQPFSTAGKRRGEEDPRHLWPWVREAISRLRPDYAILENVRGHLSMGGLSVVAELASIGYDCEWRVVSAASVGANHRRDRIIIVAYPQSQYGNVGNNHTRGSAQSETLSELGNSSGQETMADSNDSRPHRAQIYSTETRLNAFSGLGGCCENVADTDCEQWNVGGHLNGSGKVTEWDSIQSPISGSSGSVPNTDGIGGRGLRALADGRETVFGGQTELRGKDGYAGWQWWEIEPDVGRVAHGIPSRVDRLRGLGNAVVPQVAEVIGRLVIEHANA